MMEKLYYDKSGDISNFASTATYLKKALSNIQRDPTTKLVNSAVGDEWTSWGFQDNVKKQGNDLMGSLLYYKASLDMAALYTANADAANAAFFTNEATNISNNLSALWDATDGMFYAASISPTQIDILGSAYAVYLSQLPGDRGIISQAQATNISNYLVNNYSALTAGTGYIRQSPTDWGGTCWAPGSLCAPGTYDNARWSVGNEWVARALAVTNASKATQFITDFSNNADKTMEYYGVGSGANGTSNNLESPMGAFKFISDNPLLFNTGSITSEDYSNVFTLWDDFSSIKSGWSGAMGIWGVDNGMLKQTYQPAGSGDRYEDTKFIHDSGLSNNFLFEGDMKVDSYNAGDHSILGICLNATDTLVISAPRGYCSTLHSNAATTAAILNEEVAWGPTTSFNWTTGTWYRTQIARIGTTIYSKIWVVGSAEPSSWQNTYTESNNLTSTSVGFLSGYSTTNFDNLLVRPYVSSEPTIAAGAEISSDATVTSSAYNVSFLVGGVGSITHIPYGTSKTTFESNLIKGNINQSWVDTGIHSTLLTGDTLVVTAQDGTTMGTYTVTVSAPAIASVASDAAAGVVLHLGQTINFTVTPTVPEAGLTILPTTYNGRALTAWTAHNGGATYTAAYTVTAGDPDRVVPLQLLGVTATDVNGTGAATDGTDITDTIDATAPAIASITSTTPSGNNYTTGQAINITVNFSENVTSTGNVTVTLNTTPSRTCTFAVANASSGSCTYAVQAGDTVAVLGVSGISGTINDAALNAMTNFVPVTGLAASKTIAIPLYTLTYSAGAGGTISGSSPQTENYNTSGSIVTATPNAHYHFTGWSDSVVTASRTDAGIQANLTVTANFAIDTHTLTYTAGSNGSIIGSSPQTINYGSDGTLVTATPAAHYHFVSWSDGGLTASRTDLSITTDYAYTVTFAIDTFTLTYSAGSHGSLTGPTTQTVNYSASGTEVIAVPDTGYHFVGWSDTPGTDHRTDVNVMGDITVSATFAINTYTLSYIAGTHGTLTGTASQIVNVGASGSLVTAVPDTGYHFISWSDSVATATRTDTNVQANITASASFAINTYTLAYSAGANGTITGSSPQTVNYGASGTQVSATADSGYQFVNWSDASAANPRTDANVTSNITVTANFTAVVSRGGAPNDNVIVYPPTVAVLTPVGGGSYNAGSVVGLSWSAANGTFTKYKVYYSIDNGTTWTTISDNATSTSLSWTIPDNSTTLGKIKVEGYNSSNALLASGLSAGNFTIVGTIPATNNPPPTTNPPPAADPNVTGAYSSESALANTPDINTDIGLITVASPSCVSGTLIKGSLPAVYYCGADGKRYVFVNEQAYLSWYADFSTVKVISDADLAQIPLGGNVTYRPGARLVKIQTDPKVYAVARGGVLRWVMTEAVATRLYGANWNKMIDDVPDSFFVNYTVGAPIAN